MTEKASVQEGQQTLLRHAAAVVRARSRNGGYAGVSPADAADLSSTLESVAATADDHGGVDREEAVALAAKARVGLLVLVHHSPVRTDDQLDQIVQLVDSPLTVVVAREGMRIPVGASDVDSAVGPS